LTGLVGLIEFINLLLKI